MPLQRGEVRSYNFNRMAVEFTMANQGKVIPCSISTAAMDDLEGVWPNEPIGPDGGSSPAAGNGKLVDVEAACCL